MQLRVEKVKINEDLTKARRLVSVAIFIHSDMMKMMTALVTEMPTGMETPLNLVAMMMVNKIENPVFCPGRYKSIFPIKGDYIVLYNKLF